MVGLRDDQPIPREISSYVADEAQERLKESLLVVEREGFWDGQTTFRHFPSGADLPVLQHIFYIREPNTGRRLALATVCRDISQRRRTELTLSKAQQELAHASRVLSIGELTASLAHEINQPLAAIAANANAGLRWLSRATPDLEEVHAALKRINNDAHRASEVIQGIRSIFKKAPQQGALIDINDVVLEVLALVHGELINYRVSAISNLLPNLPRVRADRVQLQQVILNLIMNAVEAMGTVADRARVLNVASQLDEPNAVLVTVQDTGPGIDPNRMDRIFDAFFSTKSSGMGMGLFICRSIVESHGGRLWATAAVPQGAIFHLVLPIGDTTAG
jgi:C4-dicarboxylate-specific signal transduction histidine kinase